MEVVRERLLLPEGFIWGILHGEERGVGGVVFYIGDSFEEGWVTYDGCGLAAKKNKIATKAQKLHTLTEPPSTQ